MDFSIVTVIINNILMASLFCFFMVFCMLANTVFGISISLKTGVFNWSVLFNGILKNFLLDDQCKFDF